MSDWTDKIEEIKHFIRRGEPAAGPKDAILQAYGELYLEACEERDALLQQKRPAGPQ